MPRPRVPCCLCKVGRLTARCPAPCMPPQRPSRLRLHVALPLPGPLPCSKAHIQGEVLLDFLKDAVAEVPDLPPAGSEPSKPGRQKRQR